jgi:phage tail sheath gpL-like
MSDSLGDDLTQAIVPTITFSQIPANQQVPGNYVEIGADYTNMGLLPFPARVLVVGQMKTGSPATAGKIYQILQPGQGAQLFGAPSEVADLITAYSGTNTGIPIDAVGVAPATGGAAATGTITFSAASSVASQQAFGVAGSRVVMVVEPGDTDAIMAANFIAAAEAVAALISLPVVFTNPAGGEVLITAAYTGVLGNAIDIRANPANNDITPPGLTFAIAPMTGGTGVPPLTGVLAAIASTWYTDIVIGWNDNASIGALAEYLQQQDNAMVAMDGVGYTVWTGTQGQIAALGNGINSKFVCGLGVTNPQNPWWVIAGSLLGVAALALMNDPARQLRGLVLPGIIAPAQSDQMMEQEQQALLLDGIATYQATQEGSLAIQRLVTTYVTSVLGVPDQAWQDVMSTKVLSRIRWDWRNYVSLTYPNRKLADDGSLAAEYDPNIVTPKRLRGAWAARSRLYEQAGWIENSEALAQASTFVRDPNNRNRVNCQLKVQVIGNLMITGTQLLFEAGS